MKGNKPILVTGSHRSGTTWVGQTISQHRKVEYVHEPFNADHPNIIMGVQVDTWFSHFHSSIQQKEIRESFDGICKSDRLDVSLKICENNNPESKLSLRFLSCFLQTFLKKPRILIKDPLALFSAGWLYETYDFNVIVMIRNPFAFVGSLKKAGWDFDFNHLEKQKKLVDNWLSDFKIDINNMIDKKNDHDIIDRASLLWNILHSVILRYQQKYPQWCYIKHEELSLDPELYFKKIFNYLNLNYESSISMYIKKYTSNDNPADAPSTGYRPRNSRSNLTLWQERLSPEEVERVAAQTKSIASKFIYQELFSNS